MYVTEKWVDSIATIREREWNTNTPLVGLLNWFKFIIHSCMSNTVSHCIFLFVGYLEFILFDLNPSFLYRRLSIPICKT
jgi:hypothetical protein